MADNGKKTKALFIGPYPPPYSGPELGMKYFLESDLRNKFDITHLKTNVRKSQVNKGRFDLAMITAFFRFMWKLSGILVWNRPKLAYYPITATQTGWIGRDVWCLLLCALFGVKTVIHLRAGHLKINYDKFAWWVKILVRWSCRTVSLALVQAGCLRNQFQGLAPDDRIAVMNNAVDTDQYDNPDLDSYDPNLILYLGNLSTAKGYCDLVEIIPRVADGFPDVKFCFGGTFIEVNHNVKFDQATGAPIKERSPSQMHEEISSGPYAGNYRYLGVVSGQEKFDLLQQASFLVLPSYSEGFPLSILEAMSMGKPVVYSPVGALPEVMTDGVNGLLVKPGAPAELADKIMALLGDRAKRDEIARTNYAYTREKFALEIIAGVLGRYFDNVLNSTKT